MAATDGGFPQRQKSARAARLERVVGWLTGLIAIVALLIAVAAASHAGAVAACVNNILGTRSAPTANDAAANVQRAKDEARFYAALGAVLSAPKDQQAAEYKQFLGALQSIEGEAARYQQTVAADQASRDAHPLGRC